MGIYHSLPFFISRSIVTPTFFFYLTLNCCTPFFFFYLMRICCHLFLISHSFGHLHPFLNFMPILSYIIFISRSNDREITFKKIFKLIYHLRLFVNPTIIHCPYLKNITLIYPLPLFLISFLFLRLCSNLARIFSTLFKSLSHLSPHFFQLTSNLLKSCPLFYLTPVGCRILKITHSFTQILHLFVTPFCIYLRNIFRLPVFNLTLICCRISNITHSFFQILTFVCLPIS